MTNEELCFLAQAGNPAAETVLFEQILPSIRFIANNIKNRYPRLMLEKDDLIQEALIGSLRAINTYDPESGNLFQTYVSSVVYTARKVHSARLF